METLLVQQQVVGDSWEPQLLLPSSHPGTLPLPPFNSCNHVHHGVGVGRSAEGSSAPRSPAVTTVVD